jgi:hypothetical protein
MAAADSEEGAAGQAIQDRNVSTTGAEMQRLPQEVWMTGRIVLLSISELNCPTRNSLSQMKNLC